MADSQAKVSKTLILRKITAVAFDGPRTLRLTLDTGVVVVIEAIGDDMTYLDVEVQDGQ